MQLNPSNIGSLRSSFAASDPPAHKRPYAQETSPSTQPSSSSSTATTNRPPYKIRKVEAAHTSSASMSAPSNKPHSSGKESNSLSRKAMSGAQSSRNKSNFLKGKSRISKQPTSVLSGPVHSEEYITETYKTKPLKGDWETNPKSPLTNFIVGQLKSDKPVYEHTRGIVGGSSMTRSTLRITVGDVTVIGVGDHIRDKESERLAALSALYQLDAQNLLDYKPTVELPPSEVTLSDGSVVGYERARQFMDYYCRRFRFDKPDITYRMVTVHRTSLWQADMTVDGRLIGFGRGTNKKQAMTSCYVDVTAYLEKCDPEIWKTFVEDAKTGKDIGMAPRVLFQIDDSLEDQIQSLVDDIRRSTLYKHRPHARSQKKPDAPTSSTNAVSTTPTAPKYIAPYRRQDNEEQLKAKSEQLKARRENYLTDPKFEKMRDARAALPIFSKADELLRHIQENEVTVCMAATGSGKTTQIPQIILDDYIARGEGAKCNIICTQPRRIAAISVADRVAKERGESAGRGSSVGYQVRFEANLPDRHGSITFCTIGIFLKRMQSALQNEENMNLDEVTHIVVDEVHERDVDTDLLLVVLKRLIADRKTRKIPIKVILMSATIDSNLFQNYFPDANGEPAKVVQIPGRTFPVTKNFLDDFVPQLAQEGSAGWVFRDESVQKYLLQELGNAAPIPPDSKVLRNRTATTETVLKEDLDLPIPLIALTIAHVLRSSDDGHVLVFLPGWEDIMAVQKTLSGQLLGLQLSDRQKYSVHLLHSSIPIAEQQVIFDPPPPGIRRIILSTNIAETSVTIPDVVYVIDTGKIKEMRYDPERHISTLVNAWVGSSNLNQRAGRAGRHRSGEYFGILSRRHADMLHPHQTVEMKRVDLSNIVMHVKALDFPGVTAEEVLAATIEPPSPERVSAAMHMLKMVGAIDENHDLTSLGRVLLQLPVDVQMGRLVLFGSFFRCLDQALTLAAILTSRDPFVAPAHAKLEASARKDSWSPAEFRSDALASLRAYNAWWAMQSQRRFVEANRFCIDNFLSKPTMLMIQKVKEHLLKSLYQAGVIDVSAGGTAAAPTGPSAYRQRGDNFSVPPQLDVNGDSLPLLAALIAIGSQPKYAIRTNDKMYRTAQDKTVFIHPSSVNHRKREFSQMSDENTHSEKQIIAYADKRQNISTGQVNAQKFLVTTTRLDPLTYILFGAHHIEVTERGLECDEWLPIVGRQDALDEIERLKVMMEACMLRVFEGIIVGKARRAARGIPARIDEREDESEDEDDAIGQLPLTDTEIKELDLMTRDIVRILNHYSTYRVAIQSRSNSRPATPMDSPNFGMKGLPPLGGSRSGFSTPHHGQGSGYSSRPGTPSRLRRF